jgi:uncharacterized protein (TIGR00251 family)
LAQWYQQTAEQITLKVYVQPGAKQSEVAGLHGEALKIRLNAPAIEGRANEALIKFIAQLFNVPTRKIILKRGEKSRHKTLIIQGSTLDLSTLTIPLNTGG